jgi:SSS family solute:Na+ symporter
MYAYRLNSALPRADQALPWLVMNALPAWLAALVTVAMVSGMSSAANGTAAAAGTFWVRHIFPLLTGRFPKRPVAVARWAMVFGFLFSTVLALYTGNIVDFVKKFLPLTMSGLGVIIIIGRFWNRATWQGAVATLVATPVVSLVVMKFWPTMDSILPATVIGVVVQIVASLLTPPKRYSFDEVAATMATQRQGIEGKISQ